VTIKKPRKIPRAETRADFWEKKIADAATGREAFDAWMDWVRGALIHIERARPHEVDGLRRHLARKWSPDVRALAKLHPDPSERTETPPQPTKRARPLQPLEAGPLERGEKIARPAGPLQHLRGGQRFPGRQS
jgi:hypothetical protein